MIDIFGRTVKVGDYIIWAGCRSGVGKYKNKHNPLLYHGIVHVISHRITYVGDTQETLLVERAPTFHSARATKVLIEPKFMIIEAPTESDSS